jgi:hypothetical protein
VPLANYWTVGPAQLPQHGDGVRSWELICKQGMSGDGVSEWECLGMIGNVP